jgi:carbon-monoxide dehydrogenase large subunit
MKFALGQAVPRTEDPRLLTGRGQYTDDFVLPRLAHAYVLRSQHAHARIRSVDIRASQQMPGVLAVLTGEDWAAEKFGAPRPVIPRQRRDGSPMFMPLRPALAKDRAMLVGEPVAFVVAETVDLAKDAAERITVEYEPLPSVTATEEALSPEAPRLWPECRDNECFFFTLGDKRAVEAAFAKAHHVARLKLVFNRVTAARWSRAAASASGTIGSAASRCMSGPSARTARAPTWRGAFCTYRKRSSASLPARLAAASG